MDTPEAASCEDRGLGVVAHRVSCDGVISTRVGYSGGENDNPTDENHPGHAEAVEIRFDPERISYRDILEFCATSRGRAGSCHTARPPKDFS